MGSENREALELEIENVLREQWDPLGRRNDLELYRGYREYAHEIYNLLARGGSDVQVARRLHEAEAVELNLPDLIERDLSTVVRALRQIERRI